MLVSDAAVTRNTYLIDVGGTLFVETVVTNGSRSYKSVESGR